MRSSALLSLILVRHIDKNMDLGVVVHRQWNKSVSYSEVDDDDDYDVIKRCESMILHNDVRRCQHDETKRWSTGNRYDSQMVAQQPDPGYAARYGDICQHWCSVPDGLLHKVQHLSCTQFCSIHS